MSVGATGKERQIQNVAAGIVSSTSTDAVNGSQLYAFEDLAVKYDVVSGAVGKTKITLAGSGGTTITNVKAGAINSTSTDAVNGSQLYTVQEEAKKHTSVSGDSNVSVTKSASKNANGGDNYEVALNDIVNIGGTGANKVTIDGTAGTIVTGNINMNGTSGVITAGGIIINGGSASKTINGLTNTTWSGTDVSGQAATEDQLEYLTDWAVKYELNSNGTINKNQITLAGSGGTTITNVKAGAVNSTSTDAVNGSQLYAVQQEAGKHNTVTAGDNVVIKETDLASGGSNYEVSLADDLEIASSIDVGDGNIVIDGNDGSVTAGDVTINKDGSGTIGGLGNTDWGEDYEITSGQAATEDQLKAVSDVANAAAESAKKHTTVTAGDENIKLTETKNDNGGINYEVKLNDKVDIGSGANKVTVDGTSGTVSTGNISMNSADGKIVADKVTIDGGAGTINGLTNTTWDEENITSGQAVTEDQLQAVADSAVQYDKDENGNVNKGQITLEGTGGTKITNVASGEVSATSTDAVNGSQLYEVKQDINGIHNDISRLGDEIDSVGALSSVMAGLHPRFQDSNKGEFAMAVDGYGGKGAVAMGGFYAPNEKVMFSLGLGVSEGGSKMGNFGVNFALDRTKDRKGEARDIVYTRKEVDANLMEQNAKFQMMAEEIEQLKAQNAEFKRILAEFEALKAQLKR